MDCRGEDSQVMKVENHLMGMEENKFYPGVVTALCARPRMSQRGTLGLRAGCGMWGLIWGHGQP